MLQDQPLWIGSESQLGPRVLLMDQPPAAPLPPAPLPPAVDPTHEMIYRMAMILEGLEARVRVLEERALRARLLRVWGRIHKWAWDTYHRIRERFDA